MSITFLITQLENLVIWGVRMHPGASLLWLGTELIKVPPLLSRKFLLAFVHIPMNQFETATPVPPPPPPGAGGQKQRQG